MNPHFPLAISLIALSVVCQAQVPTDNEAYEAWKLTQIQHPSLIAPLHPAASHTATGELRGGEAPCACWIEPDSTYTIAMPETDEGHSAEITLPFTFSLFGFPFDSLYIMNNGFISFNHPFEVYGGVSFGLIAHPIVAPFFADVDTRDGTPAQDFLHGKVLYKLTSHALYVNWVSVGYYNEHGDLRNSFQVIITDGTDSIVPGGSNVSFCYGSMQWTSGDLGGVNGFGGYPPAIVGAATGNNITWVQGYIQLGSFIQNNSEWNGPNADSSGVGWLTDRHFVFNTTNAAVPPIFSNLGCDTLEIEAGLSLNYPMLMIAGLSGQVITGSSSCSGISGYMETSNTSGDTAQIISSIAPTEDEVGMHTINYTAQNDADTPLVSTYTVYVKVLPGLTTAISSISASRSLALQPNPANDKVTVSWPAELRPTLMQVIATDGSLVMTRSPEIGATRMQLDVSSLAQGVYTVRLSSSSGVSTARLVR